MGELSSTASEERTPAKAWLMLAVVYFVSFMAPIAQFKLPPLASWLIPAFGMTGVTFGYLMSALSIIGVILAFPAAYICRGIGLKRVTILSAACLAVGTLMGVATDSLAVLMVGRMIEGIGIGLIGVSAPTCVSVWFPDRTKGLALGIWATWFPIGITLMFNVAPSIANAAGWQTVFWVCFALTMVALVLFALVYKMPEGKTGDIGIEGSFKDSFAYLKNKQVWILGVTFFVFNFIQLGVINSFYNTFLETARGFDGVAAASLTSVVTIISIFAIPIAGAISDRIPIAKRKYALVLSYALFFVAFLFAWNTGANAMVTMWAFLIVVGIASGLGGGLTRPMASILMGGTAMGATVGMSILQFCQNLGGTIGAPLFGWGFETLGWETAGNLIVLPLCVVAAILSLFVTAKARKKEEVSEKASEGEGAASASPTVTVVSQLDGDIRA